MVAWRTVLISGSGGDSKLFIGLCVAHATMSANLLLDAGPYPATQLRDTSKFL